MTDTTDHQITYTVNDAMAALRIGSRQTLYRLIHDGTLESYCIGRRRYISHEQLARCIERLSSGNRKVAA